MVMFSATVNGESKIEVVTNFDVNKYMGIWYEIARLPFKFEKDLVRVTATYSLKKNGMVKVENRGINSKTSRQQTAIGKAKFAGKSDVGYLKVSFFGPFYGDYKIIELNSDYRYVLVGSSMKYLWILSRTPELDKCIVEGLVAKAQSLGFATENLSFTPQK
jgi:apolipoprotein D and lipocalin family protein